MNHIIIKINDYLKEISKFFKFNRKKYKNKIIEQLALLDKELYVTNEQKEEYFEKYSAYKNDHDIIQQNLDETNSKFNFISEILAAKPSYINALEIFRTILREDFMSFANSEASLAEEAEAVVRLQAIERELELITIFPNIYNKKIVAVGGGFSSGKSSFLNNFIFASGIKLPVDVMRATAIPTYIMSGLDNTISGFSHKGGVVDIEPRQFNEINHDFLKSLRFNLKDIMPYIALGADLESDILDYICFIDTPGYDSADGFLYSNTDKLAAYEYIEQSNAVIWIVSLESNGTIVTSDLEFLSNLDLEDKKLYIILNKADLKSINTVEEIMDTVEDILDSEDLDYEGICAYSTKKCKEYFHRRKSLFKFLEEMNTPNELVESLISRLNNVLNMYIHSINNDVSIQNEFELRVKSVRLDMLQYASGKDSSKVEENINKLLDLTIKSNLNEQVKTIEALRKKFTDAIYEIFDSLESKSINVN